MPAGVDVNLAADSISIKGPMGTLKQAITPRVKVVKEDGKLVLSVNDESSEADAMSGTLRALLANMVTGVTKGFERKLTPGGYRLSCAVARRCA